MARQVVHDDDVTGPQFRHEHLGGIGFEPVVPLLQDIGPILLDCMSSLFCASCHGAQRSGEALPQRRLGPSRPSPRVTLQGQCPCVPPKEPKYRHCALQPAANACHHLEVSVQSRRSRAAVRASGSPSMAQRQSGQLPRHNAYHRQPLPKAASANPSIEIELSMLASFTNVDCESQKPDNGNPLRFYPLEKRSKQIRN